MKMYISIRIVLLNLRYENVKILSATDCILCVLCGSESWSPSDE